jgi:hypothetical protein
MSSRPLLRLLLLTALLGVSLGLPAAPAQAGDLDLEGTWHLLVHFQDGGSEDPEAERWYDRVWKFERQGRRLQWTDYGIVVFEDSRGRFELIGATTRSRVMGYWEPNERQQKNIRDGLEIVPRESRAKSLRGSPQRGFRSSGGLRPTSASVISYHELWSITDPGGKPVFTRDDVLGSARTERMEGVTRYQTLEVLEGGNLLRGRFERDGSLHGSFQLTRAGETRAREGDEVDRRTDLDDISLGFAVDRGPLADELEGLLDEPDRAAQRERARALVIGMLEKDLRDRGQDPRAYKARVLVLAEKIEAVLIDEGASLDEVEAMLRRGELQP